MRSLLPVLLLAPALLAQTTRPAPEPLFDGKSLAGWRGDPAVWSVRDGCLVGSTVGHPIQQNTFLIWQGGELADFELSAEVRLEGDNNSGIQYRSSIVLGTEFAMRGYQCDVHPNADYFAMLYEERAAGILCQQGRFVARDADGGVRTVGQVARPVARDLTQWHRLRICARGNLVWHELDGVCVTVVQDDSTKAQRQGLLGLQVHAGPAMTVFWKNVELVRLPKEELAAQVPAIVRALLAQDRARSSQPKGLVPQWVWDESPQKDEEVFFRRSFSLDNVPSEARVSVSCDNHCRVYVNGDKVTESDAWETPATADVQKSLRKGENVIAVHGWNEGGVAGLVLRVSWTAGKDFGEIVTDASWRCSDDDPDGWNAPGFDDTKWTKTTVLAALGAKGAPWSGALGEDAFGSIVSPDAPQVAIPAEGLDGPMAKDALQLLAVPRAYGSWVSLCADDKGRLYASDQARGLFRIVPAKELGELTTIEKVDVDLDGCHGLCWFKGALYASVNSRRSGLYRLTDTNGDDRLDRVELLRSLDGSGEHGPHAVIPAPDGEHLFVMCGNHTKLPELSASRVPLHWGEDRLLPRIGDPNGHAVGIQPPGGWVCLVDPDGKNWELFCCGFRNSYDLAVLPNGDAVTYDSDMEWDMGMPWYRPTRILQLQSGVDYGWRNGSNKWSPDYPEVLPAVVDVGPGSPTGMLWTGDEVLALDWTFGTVYGVSLTAEKGGYRGELTPRLTGAPLPVTDIVRMGDQCYLLTGGRGVPSKLLSLPNWKSKSGADLAQQTERAQRGAFETKHGILDEGIAKPAFAAIDDKSSIAQAARIALEWQPSAAWSAMVGKLDGSKPKQSLTALLALARSGDQAELLSVLEALGKIAFASLSHADRIAWLRVHALTLIHYQATDDAQRAMLAARLLPLFPTGNDREDADLAELLAFVDAPGFLDKALPLLQPMRPAQPPAWAEVITRNPSYGGAIQKMISNMPPTGQIALAYALRTVKNGWTLDQRRAYFTFLTEARTRKGGASYDGYLKAFIDEAWATCTPAEQQELAELVGKAKADLPKFQSTPPKGPGRHWQLAEATAQVQSLEGANLASGRNLFHAIGCASCHYFAGEGGNHGPDLTSVGNKFRAADLLEAILEPSKVISDQYSGSVVTKRDGSAVFGRASKMTAEGAEFWEVMPATADAVPMRIAIADVAKIEPSKLSPMPTGLVDGLNAGELRDLVAFVMSRGAPVPEQAGK
jgi:putative heme-binding domain-containing protein